MKRLEEQKEKKTEFESFWVEKKIYFQMNNIQMKIKSKKLNNKSIESFKIVRDIKKISYELNLFKEMWIHLIFYAFMLQHCNQIISSQIIKMSVEFNKEYEIKNILEKKMISEKIYYLVKWKRYNISENIWKFKENLKNCTKTLQHFEKRIESNLRRLMT